MSIARRVLRIAMLLLVVLLGAGTMTVAAVETRWFKDWLRGYIAREARQYLNGELTIGRLHGNLFFGVTLDELAVSLHGHDVVRVEDVSLRYNVFELVSRGVSLDEIHLNRPTVRVRRDGDSWSIARIVKEEAAEADREGPRRPITIDSIVIADGEVIVESPVDAGAVVVPRRVDQIDARLAFAYKPVDFTVDIDHVRFRTSDPDFTLSEFAGTIAVHDQAVYLDKIVVRTPRSAVAVDGAIESYVSNPVTRLKVKSETLSLPEFVALVPALSGVEVEPAFDLSLDGPLDRLGIGLRLSSSAGNATATLIAGLSGPKTTIQGGIAVERLNLAPILGRADLPTDISGTMRADVQAVIPAREVYGTVHVETPKLSVATYAVDHVTVDARLHGQRMTVNAKTGAYGAAATTSGSVGWTADASNVRYDLQGAARRLNLARLPRTLQVPAVVTDLNANYRLRGVNANLEARATFQPSAVEGAHIAGGSMVHVKRAGRAIAYGGDVHLADLNPRRLGLAFGLAALDHDRYDAVINAHVAGEGHGTRIDEIVLNASGTITDSRVAGGGVIPETTFDVAIQSDVVHVTAAGQVADINPAAFGAEARLDGRLAGAFDIDATLTGVSAGVTPESVNASIYTTLEPSQIGPIVVRDARLSAHYAESTATITELLVDGPDLHVDAAGALSLNGEGRSQLAFNADSTALETIGGAFDQDVSGIGKVAGLIEGNRSNLRATGELTADSLRYRTLSALTVTSDYRIELPDLDVARARAETDSHATFVVLGGQEINELGGKVEYDRQEVKFDATAKQPERALTAAGTLRLLPDQQELRLEHLTLQTQAGAFETSPGTVAEVDYGGGSVAVRNLALASGAQRIVIEGTLGRPDETLTATLTDVELASIDALLLREPQFSGRLNMTAVASGEMKEPAVEAKFVVDQGGFRDFRYERLEGTVDYADAGVMLDARLQQNANAWVKAAGFVPRAAFSTPNPDLPDPSSGRRIDLTVESSTIDLGIVQGFTTQVTEVTGTLQANLRVTGSPENPQATGAITLADGALTVEETGVKYTDVKGRLDFKDDRVDITDLHVLDDDRDELVVTGQVAIAKWQIGAVNARAVAHDFDVLDNEMGRLRVNTDLTLIGTLGELGIWGNVGLTTGRLDIDPLLARLGNSAYDVKPIAYATTPVDGRVDPLPAEPAEKDESDGPSFYESLQFGLELTVPDDLVVRGRDIKTPGSSIGLGAMNITLGGDLWIQKNPLDVARVTGIVNTVRGTYDFQDRRFEILRDGSVRFDGLDTIDPTLNIRARRVIQGVEAFVSVRGTVSEPRLELSSVPPLEQADVLALIVFNQPLSELGEGQQVSLSERATSMASGVIADQLAGSIGRALKLDTFEISTAPESGGDVQVTAGQQVGQRAYIKLQQGIGDQNQSNFIFEYQFLEWLRLQSNFLVGAAVQQSLFNRLQGSGADLVIVWPRTIE